MSDNTLASEISWDENVTSGSGSNFKKSRKLERIKFKVGPAVRLLLLNEKPVAVVQHYKKEFGYIRCLLSTGQRCPACEANDRPTQKFGINILVYPMGAEKPTDVNSANCEVKAWLFNAKVFNDLKNIKSEWGALTSFDLKVNCTPGKEQFQEVTVQNCSSCLMTQSPDALNLQAKIELDAFDLKWHLGRAFSVDQVDGLWSGKLSKDDIFKKKEDSPYAAAREAAPPATPVKLNFNTLLSGNKKSQG